MMKHAYKLYNNLKSLTLKAILSSWSPTIQSWRRVLSAPCCCVMVKSKQKTNFVVPRAQARKYLYKFIWLIIGVVFLVIIDIFVGFYQARQIAAHRAA